MINSGKTTEYPRFRLQGWILDCGRGTNDNGYVHYPMHAKRQVLEIQVGGSHTTRSGKSNKLVGQTTWRLRWSFLRAQSPNEQAIKYSPSPHTQSHHYGKLFVHLFSETALQHFSDCPSGGVGQVVQRARSWYLCLFRSSSNIPRKNRI